jgi:hypothetical protein
MKPFVNGACDVLGSLSLLDNMGEFMCEQPCTVSCLRRELTFSKDYARPDGIGARTDNAG